MQQMEEDHQCRVQQLQRDVLAVTQDLGEQLRKRDAKLGAVQAELEASERDRARMRDQLQELRKRNAKR